MVMAATVTRPSAAPPLACPHGIPAAARHTGISLASMALALGVARPLAAGPSGDSWLSRWWSDEVIAGHKGPLLLCFVAFVLTFVAARTITRAIRAGRGPFHNLSDGGTHLHHSTPGLVLLVTGAFLAVGTGGRAIWPYVASLLVGVGSSLVLDEFAMIFRLQDVYWTQEGQLSVNIVTLSAACLGLGVLGISPLDVGGLSDVEFATRASLAILMALHGALVVITALKGKYPTALIGLFVAPVIWYAVLRLARPTSPWARWFYRDPHRLEHAQRRAERFDARWGPVRQRWDDLIGGTPTTPTTPTASTTSATSSTSSTPAQT